MHKAFPREDLEVNQHTHVHAHTYTHTHIIIHVCTHMHVHHTHTNTNSYMHTCTHAYILHTHTHRHIDVCTHIHPSTLTYQAAAAILCETPAPFYQPGQTHPALRPSHASICFKHRSSRRRERRAENIRPVPCYCRTARCNPTGTGSSRKGSDWEAGDEFSIAQQL